MTIAQALHCIPDSWGKPFHAFRFCLGAPGPGSQPLIYIIRKSCCDRTHFAGGVAVVQGFHNMWFNIFFHTAFLYI
ncbi:hypothetical protein CR164_11025 [Prosthecochloris marina]|uniref:Uncharacterized protein n=1 Tax=Prosthecochloris marina TaxID=2017681 RepID=A0A317T727_9CHLB|nr:hypothetical protein CR164_11025 [Prosthecochloris marina]